MFTQVENMNNSNRSQYKYSAPYHQKIRIEEVIDFLRKIFLLCKGRLTDRGQIYKGIVRHVYSAFTETTATQTMKTNQKAELKQ